MTDRKNQQRTGQQGGRGSLPRQAPKIKGVESGEAGQEDQIEGLEQEPEVEQPAAREGAPDREREEYHRGGIPIGSDPRE